MKNIYIIFLLITIFISCCTQLMLKLSASNKEKKGIAFFVNKNVIMSYLIYFVVLIVNSYYIYKNLSLNQIGIIESAGYIYIPILSFIFLKEKISKKQIFGILLILMGILIYNL